MAKLPTYQAVLETSEDGITCISWVQNPATAIDMICFSEEEKQKYTFAEDDKHMVTSVVMLADTKIYRNNFGFEYYITYDKDTLIKMCEKMLSDNTFNEISFEHDGNIIEKGIISLVELYTVDENKKSPFNIPEGSIVATYKVNDSSVWELFKSGSIGGVSLEGYFAIKEVEKYEKKDSMLDKIKNTLKELLVEVESEATIHVENSIETPETTETETPETEPTETQEETQEETETPENETEPQEETQEFTEETPGEKEEETETEEPEVKKDDEPENNEPEVNEDANKIATLEAKVTELTGIIEGLTAEIDAIKTKIVEIETKPAVPAIEEEYQQTPKTDNKWANLGSLLK